MTKSQRRNRHNFCSEPLDKIEHYEEALAENFKGWCIHHRLEIQPNGTRVSVKELIDQGLYFHRPASELVFMRTTEHKRLHCIGNTYMKGKHHSAESCQKIAEANKGRTFSAETRLKMSAALKGRTFSEETRKKNSLAHKGENHPFFGKHHSAETRQKMSAAAKGKHKSAETRNKIAEARKGKHHSAETRKKLSEALKGKPTWNKGKTSCFSKETLQKKSKSMTGKLWWTNGIQTKLLKECPGEGWTRGRLRFK